MGKTLIDNPCYHCYTGAIGECLMTSCKYQQERWSKDINTFELEIDITEDNKEIYQDYIKE